MWAFLTKLWNGLVRLLSVLLPFGKQHGPRARSPAVRWALHLTVLALVLVLLYVLGLVLRLETAIPTGRFRVIAHVWLPLVFLLVYLLAWNGWWIYKLLISEDEAEGFPDIDAAWEEAMQALAEAGIRLTDVPLFLVLGRPEAPEESLFQAAQLMLSVPKTPKDPRAPLHVYANRDAVFVTCARSSLLGKQASYLALEDVDPSTMTTMEAPDGAVEEALTAAGATIRPQGKEKRVIQQLRKIRGREPTSVEKREMRRLADKKTTDLLARGELVETLSARLRYLCRLIVRDRQPYCPLNGLLLVVPFGGSDTPEDARQTGEVSRRDLTTVRRALRVNCPVFALVADLETARGFREFLRHQDVKARLRRIGQRFPLATDLPEPAHLEAVKGSISWMCTNLLQEWVYHLFRLEKPGKEEFGTAVTSNAELYELLYTVHDRQERLGQILTWALTTESDAPWLYGGCYLAGTGLNKDQDQGFVGGVLKRLLEEQNNVAWTPEALAEDAGNHRTASVGFAVLGVLWVAVLAGLGYYLFGPGRTSPPKKT